jgi:hypothetical protein
MDKFAKAFSHLILHGFVVVDKDGEIVNWIYWEELNEQTTASGKSENEETESGR